MAGAVSATKAVSDSFKAAEQLERLRSPRAVFGDRLVCSSIVYTRSPLPYRQGAFDSYAYLSYAPVLVILGLFCHIDRALLTLTHTSGMLMYIGLFRHMNRPLFPDI